MRDYEHIGRRVGAVVHTAEGAGRIEVVVVAPIGSVADMAVAVADHNLAEAAAGCPLGASLTTAFVVEAPPCAAPDMMYMCRVGCVS